MLATTTTAAGGDCTRSPACGPAPTGSGWPPANFTGSGPLVGFTSSTASSTDPNDNADNDNNGTTAGTLGSGGSVERAVTLSAGGEPTTDGDDDDTNLTLDFGLVAAGRARPP